MGCGNEYIFGWVKPFQDKYGVGKPLQALALLACF